MVANPASRSSSFFQENKKKQNTIGMHPSFRSQSLGGTAAWRDTLAWRMVRDSMRRDRDQQSDRELRERERERDVGSSDYGGDLRGDHSASWQRDGERRQSSSHQHVSRGDAAMAARRRWWGVMLVVCCWMAALHHTFRFATVALMSSFASRLPLEIRALGWPSVQQRLNIIAHGHGPSAVTQAHDTGGWKVHVVALPPTHSARPVALLPPAPEGHSLWFGAGVGMESGKGAQEGSLMEAGRKRKRQNPFSMDSYSWVPMRRDSERAGAHPHAPFSMDSWAPLHRFRGADGVSSTKELAGGGRAVGGGGGSQVARNLMLPWAAVAAAGIFTHACVVCVVQCGYRVCHIVQSSMDNAT